MRSSRKSHKRPGHKRAVIATACIGAIAAGAFVVVRAADASDTTPTTDGDDFNDSNDSNDSTDGAQTADSAKLIAADERDLIRSEEFDASVGHGDQAKLRVGGDGTITGLPAIGDIIDFGQSLLEVDGEPVLYLQGDRPAWRELGPGVTGEDVRQLEAALVTMGYAESAKVEVDDTWSSATTIAVKLMQRWMGLPIDGRLATDEIVFGPAPIRIAEIEAGLGDSAAEAGIQTSELEQSIDLTISASKAHLVDVGATVDVELPSGEIVPGTIASVGTPETSEDGKKTVPVVIDAGVLDLADGTPVSVTVNIVAVSAATAVPAAALLALAEGGYAVEVPDSSAATGTRLVRVEIGEFADGWVEITGEIEPGDQVVVP